MGQWEDWLAQQVAGQQTPVNVPGYQTPAAMYAAPGQWSGLQQPGNLDLNNRPSVANPEGGRSSVYSMSVNFDGVEYLLPRVSEDGRLMSEDEAVAEFQRTGRHLGVFDTPQNATAYAEGLHQQQAAATPPSPSPVQAPAPPPDRPKGKPEPPPLPPLDISNGFKDAFYQSVSREDFNALNPQEQLGWVDELLDQDPETAGLSPHGRAAFLDEFGKLAKAEHERLTKEHERKTSVEGKVLDLYGVEDAESVVGPDGELQSTEQSQFVGPQVSLARFIDDHPTAEWVAGKIGRVISGSAQGFAYAYAGTGQGVEAAAEWLDITGGDSKIAQELSMTLASWGRQAKAAGLRGVELMNRMPVPERKYDLEEALKSWNPLKIMDASVDGLIDSVTIFGPAIVFGRGAGGMAAGSAVLGGITAEEAESQGVDLSPIIGTLSGVAQMALERVAGIESMALKVAGVTSIREVKKELGRSAVRWMAELGVEMPLESAQEWINYQTPKWSTGEAALWTNLSEEEKKAIVWAGIQAGFSFGPVMALTASVKGRQEKNFAEILEAKQKGAAQLAAETGRTSVLSGVQPMSENQIREIRFQNAPEFLVEAGDAQALTDWANGVYNPPPNLTDEQEQQLADSEATIESVLNPAPISMDTDLDELLDGLKETARIWANAHPDQAAKDEALAAADTLHWVDPPKSARWAHELVGIAKMFNYDLQWYDADSEVGFTGMASTTHPGIITVQWRGATPGKAVAATFLHELTHGTTFANAALRKRLSDTFAKVFPEQWAEATAVASRKVASRVDAMSKSGKPVNSTSQRFLLDEETLAYFVGTEANAEAVFAALANPKDHALALEDPRGFKKLLRAFQAFMREVTAKSPAMAEFFKPFMGKEVTDETRQAAKFAQIILDGFREGAKSRPEIVRKERTERERPRPRYVPAGYERITLGDLKVGDEVIQPGGQKNTVASVKVDGDKIQYRFEGESHAYKWGPDHLMYRKTEAAAEMPDGVAETLVEEIAEGDFVTDPNTGKEFEVTRVDEIGGKVIINLNTPNNAALVYNPGSKLPVRRGKDFKLNGETKLDKSGFTANVQATADGINVEIIDPENSEVVVTRQFAALIDAEAWLRKVNDMRASKIRKLTPMGTMIGPQTVQESTEPLSKAREEIPIGRRGLVVIKNPKQGDLDSMAREYFKIARSSPELYGTSPSNISMSDAYTLGIRWLHDENGNEYAWRADLSSHDGLDSRLANWAKSKWDKLRYGRSMDVQESTEPAAAGPEQVDIEDPAAKMTKGKFKSRVFEVIKSSPNDTFTSKKFLAWIKKQQGVKAEELEWTRLEAWLGESDRTLTKREILEFLDTHYVQIKEEIIDGDGSGALNSEIAQQRVAMARTAFKRALRKYYADTGEGPLALVEANDELQNLVYDFHQMWVNGDSFGRPSGIKPQQWSDLVGEYSGLWDAYRAKWAAEERGNAPYFRGYVETPWGEDYRELVFSMPDNEFQHPMHWKDPDIPGVFGWGRFNTRYDSEGRKILFIEEIQSDLHQKGKRRGYKKELSAGALASRITIQQMSVDDLMALSGWGDAAGYYKKRGVETVLYAVDSVTEREFVGFAGRAELMAHIRQELENVDENALPDAPFKNEEWNRLVIKRLIAYAAEHGFDGISWTTADEQVKRWSGHGEKGLRHQYTNVIPNQVKKLVKPHGVSVENMKIEALDKVGNASYGGWTSADNYMVVVGSGAMSEIHRFGSRKEAYEFENSVNAAVAGRDGFYITDSMREATLSNPEYLFEQQILTGETGPEVIDWGTKEWNAFGKKHGIENMGGKSRAKKVGKVKLPGGTDGTWTFEELLIMQAMGINPATAWTVDEHSQVMRKLHRTLTPEGLEPLGAFNQFIFAMLSPGLNINLNEMAYSLARVRNMDEVRNYAKFIPWNILEEESPGWEVYERLDDKTKAEFKEWLASRKTNPFTGDISTKDEPWMANKLRRFYDAQILREIGLQELEEGGIGAVGQNQTSNIAEMAQLFLVDPDWFIKGKEESWEVFTQRIATQIRGLGFKTAMFGGVWQDPLNASVSAIDRHMARVFKEIIINTVGRAKFEERVMKAFKKNYPNIEADNFDEAVALEEGQVAFLEVLINIAGSHGRRLYNAEIDSLQKWLKTPKYIQTMGKAYRAALEANRARAAELGLGVFTTQHLMWDRERQRFETHAAMFPGLYKAPRMRVERMAQIRQKLVDYGRIQVTKEEDEFGELRLTVTEPAPLGEISFLEMSDGAPQLSSGLMANPGIVWSPNSSGAAWFLPENTWWTEAVRRVQDKFNRVLGLQKAIESIGATITDDINVYQYEMLYHGVVADRVEGFDDEFVVPLLDSLREADIKIEDFERYLYARHAKERNARYRMLYQDNVIAMIDDEIKLVQDEIALANQAGTSTTKLTKKLSKLTAKRDRVMNAGVPTAGMSDATADKILKDVGNKYDAQAKLFDSMMNQKLDIMLADGLISDDLHTKLRDTYKYYVPLKGKDLDGDIEELVDALGGGTGIGFDIRGDEVGQSFGRVDGAVATHGILAQAVVDIQSAIVRAEKNKVAQAFMELVKQYPNDDVYEISKEVKRRVLDRETGTVKFVSDSLAKRAVNVLAVKQDGETFYITIKDSRLAMAMKNLGSGAQPWIIKALGAANRIMAKLNTTLDPEFIIANFTRDLQTAMVHLNEKQAKGIAWKTMGDLPSALAGIRDAEFGDGASQWAQYYDEFKRNGGKIGFFGFSDVIAVAKAMQRRIALEGDGATKFTIRKALWMGQLVERSNSVFENGVRLSAYVNSRKAGMTEKQAAAFARNLTVNFNKKGDWGTTMNAIWLFSNASIQGSARMLTSLFTNKSTRWIATAQFMSSFVLAALNDGMGGDDDEDGMTYWEKMPDWMKENNAIVIIPETGGRFIKIPLPYGYNVFNVLGVEAYKIMRKGVDGQLTVAQTARSSVSVADALIGAFSPFGSARLDTPYGVLRQGVPTILAPIADSLRNETYYGAPIQPTRSSWDKSPNSERYFESVSDTSRELTAWANRVTGGNAYQPGVVDMSPEVLDYLVGAYAGASVKTGRRTLGLVEALLNPNYEKMEANDVPFLRRIYGEQNDHTVASVFYDNLEVVQQAQEAWENLRKEPGFDAADWRERHGWKMRVFEDMKRAVKAIRETDDPDLKNKIRKRFNKKYRLAWESQF